MKYLSKNILYLRKLKGWSQKQSAQKAGVGISTFRKCEKGQSLPLLVSLEKFGTLFQRSLDEILYIDLEKEDAKLPSNLSGKKIRILPILVDSDNKSEHVSLVPIKAAAGYASGFADAEFIADLNKFSLPFSELSQDRTYRVFQIEGDSMLPIKSGSYIICEYLQDWQEINNSHSYVVLTRDEGIVFKRLQKTKDNLIELHSDNEDYNTYKMPYTNISEIWKARGYVCFDID